MLPETLLSRLEAADPDEARRLLSNGPLPEGLSQAFGDRVAELYGSDPSRAARLAAHWRLLMRRGDGAHHLYRAKAIGERSNGKWRQSAESFVEAGRRAPNSIERLSFQRGAVDSLGRAGKIEEAVLLGTRLYTGLQRHGETEMAARVRLNVGNALLWADEYEKARKWFRIAADGLKNPREQGAALLGLAGSELFGGHPDKTREHAEEALARFQNSGDTFYADLCRLTLAQEALLRGRADEALTTLVEVRDRLAEIAPVDHARAQEFAGDAQMLLNLWQEAEDSYREALETTALPLNRANCEYGVGLALAAQGDAAGATKALRRAAKRYAALGNRAWAGAAKVAVAEVLLAEGKRTKAAEMAREAAAELKSARSHYHRAGANLVLASAEYNAALTRSAEKLIQLHGYRGLAWKVHAIRASNAANNLPHYRKMFEAILDARLLTSSSVSRLAFLRDKSDALARYLGELLRRPDGVEEALRVISQSRSVALIDEILSASVPAEASKRLEELREELNRLAGPGGPTGSTRFAPVSPERLARLQRRWIEATRTLPGLTPNANVRVQRECVVLADTADGFYAIRNGEAIRLPISAAKLDEVLHWLDFELLGPMVSRSVGCTGARDLIAELRQGLAEPWMDGAAPVPISPDGRLWRVPWQAVLAPSEAILLPTPVFSAAAAHARLPKSPKAAIWCHDAGDLPNVAREREAFLKAFPNARVVTTLREALSLRGKLDVLHVATHARAQTSNPMFSSIQLADGWLPAADIARSSLRPALVTLSACDTGKIVTWSRSEPDGLARSFLARGAKAVLAASWPLDDQAALRMMETYYAALSGGETVLNAVVLARTAVRSCNKHPYFWAPFVLFGGYHTIGRDL